MNNNTKLVNALLKGEDISEIFRAEVEKAINTALEAKLTGFLNYEKHSVEGYNTGNSRKLFKNNIQWIWETINKSPKRLK